MVLATFNFQSWQWDASLKTSRDDHHDDDDRTKIIVKAPISEPSYSMYSQIFGWYFWYSTRLFGVY